MTRALLVDFDGTLADTAVANHAAYAHALGEVGIELDRATFERIAFGRNWRQFLPEVLAQAGCAAAPQAVAARKVAIYPRYFDAILLNHALLGLLRAFRASGRVALVTAASRANVGAILAHHALADLFDVIVTGDDVVRHKPDPEGYHRAADLLGVQPADCIVIEDSDVGVAAGVAFGAPVLRVML